MCDRQHSRRSGVSACCSLQYPPERFRRNKQKKKKEEENDETHEVYQLRLLR
jgi:hypothetical protein